MAMLAAITGGLHLDGLADTADGLFLWGDAERRLAVMRDPHVGSYGLIAIALTLIGKYAALSSLATDERGWGIFAAVAISRTAILTSAGRAQYARPEGTGRLVVEATTTQEALTAAGLVILIGTLCGRAAGLLGGGLVIVGSVGLTSLAARRLGGITGDILGALVEISETAYLVAMSCLG
jgi:adenosylcobinamide-GDP ribazoletransferase